MITFLRSAAESNFVARFCRLQLEAYKGNENDNSKVSDVTERDGCGCEMARVDV